MKIGMIEGNRAVIVLERSEIKAAQRVLSLIRLKTEAAEIFRTWALIKLECIRRMK